MRTLVFSAAIACVASTATAAPLQIYFNDFDNAATVAGGVTAAAGGIQTTEIVQGLAGLGLPGNQFAGNFLRNTTTGSPAASAIFIFGNLSAHNSIDLDFLFAAIDSWDSTNGSVSPDLFEVIVDGNLEVTATFANTSGSITTAFGTDIGSGAQARGFNTFLDRAFDTSSFAGLTIPHTDSSVTIAFRANGAGWQGGTDESWGIDNLSVTINTVEASEPAGLALALGGVAGLAALRRRA